MAGESPMNWRDGSAYVPLLEADRSMFAWEWLRRDPSYRNAAGKERRNENGRAGFVLPANAAASQWGLHAFEAPERGVPEARPVWRRDVLARVLCAKAERAGAPEDCFDIGRLQHFATIVDDGDGSEHLLLSDGRRSLRIDLVGSLCAGQALLEYCLAGFTRLTGPLLVLRQLLALLRDGDFSPALHRPETRAARWILALRAHDGMTAGATQREIAEVLLSADAAAPRWRVHAPTVRSAVQRLLREAKRMEAGGYLALL